MNTLGSQPISVYNNFSIRNVRKDLPDNVANSVPNGLVKISEPQNNKNVNNNLKNTSLRQIYVPKLAPSSGSLTENFLKSRARLSPIFRFNEMASKYEMVSVAPITLNQVKKNINLVI